MNKLTQILIAIILITSIRIEAQTTGTTNITSEYGILSNKIKKSDEGKDDVKKNIKSKFWIQRAELMMQSYDVNRQYLTAGTQPLIVKAKFGEPKEVKQRQEQDGIYEDNVYDKVTITYKNGAVDSYTETQPLYVNPLQEALKSLEKAEELDVEKKDSKEIKKQYDELKKMLERQAIESYSKGDYNGSLDYFKYIIAINEKPVLNGVVDTIIFYNAAMTAARIGNSDEAIKYYELARKYNHKEPNLYVFLKQKYFEVGDTAKGLEVIEDGFKKFPASQSVLIELINYYLVRNEANKALEYLQLAKNDDPNNISFIFAEATLYDKSGNKEKAKETYLKTTEMDPNYFNGYYNLGVMYYNEAVKLYEDASKVPDSEYKKVMDQGDEALRNAIPYMKKAHEVDPTERSCMETLKTIYFRLNMTEEHEADRKSVV